MNDLIDRGRVTQWVRPPIRDTENRGPFVRCVCFPVLKHTLNEYMRHLTKPPQVQIMACHLFRIKLYQRPWRRHQMETFSALLALCAGNSPVTGEFPSQRPVTRSFDVWFHLCLKKRFIVMGILLIRSRGILQSNLFQDFQHFLSKKMNLKMSSKIPFHLSLSQIMINLNYFWNT